MPKISEYVGKKIFVYKQKKKDAEPQLVKLGKVRRAIFTPEGTTLLGYLVSQPDIAGMIKRPDILVPFDTLEFEDKKLVLLNPDHVDDAVLDDAEAVWDECIIWQNMEVKTTKSKSLGYVQDASYDEETGEVVHFLVGDGDAAEKLVGDLAVPASMLVRYKDGCMIVKNAAAKAELTGGAAAVAGEGYARAKASATRAGKKAAETASRAGKKAARATGKQIGRVRGMFSAFKEEFDKASK